MSDIQAGHVGRIPSSTKLRRLGPINWVLAKAAARVRIAVAAKRRSWPRPRRTRTRTICFLT